MLPQALRLTLAWSWTDGTHSLCLTWWPHQTHQKIRKRFIYAKTPRRGLAKGRPTCRYATWYSSRAWALLMFSLVPTKTKGTMP